jgi:hypothetical protein
VKIKKVWSDNGTEFKNMNVDTFLDPGHVCPFVQTFAGVVPSLHLFRHFFTMRLITGAQISSCVCFRLANKLEGMDFPSLGLYM